MLFFNKKFYNFISTKSNHLAVYFTGLGRVTYFEWAGSVKRLNLSTDVLFFIDNKEMFYIEGIEGFTKSEDETIKKIIEYGDYERYNFIGSSMGGYAAISHARKIAKILNNKKINILVFNPFINPNQSEFGYKFKKDISLENEKDNYEGKKIYVVGKKQNDQMQLNYLKKDHWIVKEYDCDQHFLAQYLKSNNLLDDILLDFFKD